MSRSGQPPGRDHTCKRPGQGLGREETAQEAGGLEGPSPRGHTEDVGLSPKDTVCFKQSGRACSCLLGTMGWGSISQVQVTR